MGNFYIRVEAVNLGQFVYDTYDISTIRGGSFMLLEAVKEFCKHPELNRMKQISLGASTGIFRIPDSSEDEVKDLILNIEKRLLELTCGYGTFVIDYYDFDTSTNYQKNIKQLISKNHYSQFKQPTLVFPNGKTGESKPCIIDNIRPGIERYNSPKTNEKEPISEFTKKRREFKIKSKSLKTELFKELTEIDEEYDYVNDLEALCKDSPVPSLEGKMAFIYVDGNKFSRIRNDYCKNEITFGEFDKKVQIEFRKKFLTELVQNASQDNEFKFLDVKMKQEQLRLELLLWGGDEIEMVVPAWKGLEVLQTFYNREVTLKDYPLTHACGVVFCHHNAPILHIRKLAHTLAENVKQDIKSIPERREDGDFIQYMVLESFDMVSSDLDTFVDSYYGNGVLPYLKLSGWNLQGFIDLLATITKYFPHNKVYSIIRNLKSDPYYNPEKDVENAISIYNDEQKEKIKNALNKILNSTYYRWFVIADLWDFVNK